MSIFEYDKEEEERKLREAEYEAGREDGRKEGELQKAQKVVLALSERRIPVEEMAKIVDMDETMIRKWIE